VVEKEEWRRARQKVGLASQRAVTPTVKWLQGEAAVAHASIDCGKSENDRCPLLVGSSA
jgi:hypothetical protein